MLELHRRYSTGFISPADADIRVWDRAGDGHKREHIGVRRLDRAQAAAPEVLQESDCDREGAQTTERA